MRFAGYAALFGRPDKGGDIIRQGAFARALERSGEVPLLWQHRAGAVIGRIEHLSEDERGLRVIAAVGDARAARVLAARRVDGLSFGYRVREAKSAAGLRELLSAWRDAKRTAWRAVVMWLVRIAFAVLLIGIAVRLRLTDLIGG